MISSEERSDAFATQSRPEKDDGPIDDLSVTETPPCNMDPFADLRQDPLPAKRGCQEYHFATPARG
jgi:hypothetical protein